MNRFESLPKTIKRTIRYIKQDAPAPNLVLLRKLINETIDKRIKDEVNKEGKEHLR